MCNIIYKKATPSQQRGFKLPLVQILKALKGGQSYKYLGVLEFDRELTTEMRTKIEKEFIRKVRKTKR